MIGHKRIRLDILGDFCEWALSKNIKDISAPVGALSSRSLVKVAAFIVLGFGLSACNSTSSGISTALNVGQADINNKTKFSSAAYGVAASPRLTTSNRVKKGGGRAVVGKPYKIKGKWYYPKEDFNYDKVGMASWYGPNFHGRLTANGEIYDQNHLSAAHPTFPLPSYARVTNQANGKSVIVRVNDRGPYAHGRIIDLSSRAADTLDTKAKGVAKVRVQYIGRAPLHGQDMAYLSSSYRDSEQGIIGKSTQFASNIFRSKPKIAKPTTVAVNTPKVAKAPRRDLLTTIAGPKVYVPSAEVTGTVKPAAATTVVETPSKTPDFEKPIVLTSVSEAETVKKKLIKAKLLQKYKLRKSN